MFLALLPLLLLGARGPRAGRGAVVPPSWADPRHNPCAAQPGGWQLLLWPADGRCYRIFRRGHPCPASMELSPGVGRDGAPGCRCPPGTAQLAQAAQAAQADANQCHTLLEQGPCPPGQYLAPLPTAAGNEDRVPSLWGACRPPDTCPPGHVFWARDGRCYPRLTRGPCYRGELLVPRTSSGTSSGSSASTSTPLGVCRCEARGLLARYYSPLTKTCHEHYTPGPCQEKGHLFLPNGQCGCSADLPHYHAATGHCHQIDTIGPCPAGHRFTVGRDARDVRGQARAQCQCKGGHVPWTSSGTSSGTSSEASTEDVDAACYRPWTRGPCAPGQLLSNSSECVAAPCRPGRLYFPEVAACYKVGVRGPCPKGQVVLFESAVRPALEGISYRGMCGCTGPNARSSSNDITGKVIEDNRCSSSAEEKDASGVKRISTTNTSMVCESKAGAVLYNGTCHTLYSQGPCPFGQWLVPQREGRGFLDPQLTLWSDSGGARPRKRARCDCRPGHKPVLIPNSKSQSNITVLECQPPTVVLATFLNSRGFSKR